MLIFRVLLRRSWKVCERTDTMNIRIQSADNH